MHIKVRNFRGCQRADIVLAPIGLLVGANYAGKSSVCQAVAAALTGNAAPFFRASKPDKTLLTKTDAKQLLAGGTDHGSVEISFDGKVIAAANWPAITASGTGEAACTKYACGLINPMDLDDVERQRLFSDLLKSTPTDEDLMATLVDARLTGQVATDLKGKLALNGWEVTYKGYKEDGARLKGQWEAASGTQFGAKKAADWCPEGWREDLANHTLEGIGTDCSIAQAKVEATVAALAVGQDEITRIAAEINAIPAAEAALAEARAMLEKATITDAAAQKAAAEIHVPVAVPCPHCGGMLDTAGDELRAATQSQAEINALAEKLALAEQRVNGTESALAKATEAHRGAKTTYDALAGAKARLAAAKTRTGTQDAVDLARDLLAGLERDKARITARLTADRLARMVATNQVLVDIVAPDGLRRQKLARALEDFNKSTLAPLCAAASYPNVSIDQDLEVLYGGRRYFLLSASEQYRVRAVLQVAMAKMDGSPVVILDGADILDAEGRDGLFGMLISIDDLGFLVAMTLNPEDVVPDLAELGCGVTYLIDKGIAKAVQARQAAAA